MDSKGVSRLQATGTMKAANGGAEQSPTPLPVSVREIARFYEARNQTNASGAERRQPERVPKPMAVRVGRSPWPPEENRRGDRVGTAAGVASCSSAGVDLEQTRGVSVKDVQMCFEEGDGDRNTKSAENVKATGDRPKRAARRTPPLGSTGNYAAGDMSSARSVKSGEVFDFVQRRLSFCMRRDPSRSESRKEEGKEEKEEEERAVDDDDEEEEAEESHGMAENMACDLELTWRNDLVMANSLLRVASDVTSPPTDYFFYQGGAAAEPYPAETPGASSGDYDVTSQHRAATQRRRDATPDDAPPGENEGASGGVQALISTVPEVNALAAGDVHVPSFQSRAVRDHENKCNGAKEPVVASALPVCSSAASEISLHEPDVCPKKTDLELLNQILDDLDRALLSALTSSSKDGVLRHPDQLCSLLTHLTEERERVFLGQRQQNYPDCIQRLGTLMKDDSATTIYQKEMTELNKDTADCLSLMGSINEEHIKAVIINHRTQQGELFTRLLAAFPAGDTAQASQCTTTRSIRPQQASAASTSGLQKLPDLPPAVEAVNVLSRMTAAHASSLSAVGNFGNESDSIIVTTSGAPEVGVVGESWLGYSSDAHRVASPLVGYPDAAMSADVSLDDVAISLQPPSPAFVRLSATRGQQDAVVSLPVCDAALPTRGAIRPHPDTQRPEVELAGTGEGRTAEAGIGEAGNTEVGTGEVETGEVGIIKAGTMMAGTEDVETMEVETVDAVTTDVESADAVTMEAETMGAGTAEAESAEEETEEAGTFIENDSGMSAPTFSRVNDYADIPFYCSPDGLRLENTFSCSFSRESSCSEDGEESQGGPALSDGEESHGGPALSDGDGDGDEDEGDDLRLLQQHYGEILQWSDAEKFSQSSDDDESMADVAKNADDHEPTLEQGLKMSLTLNISRKLPTLTEKDLASMMSEYREAITQAAMAKVGWGVAESGLTPTGGKLTAATCPEAGKGGEPNRAGGEEETGAATGFNSDPDALHPTMHTGDSGLGDTGSAVTSKAHVQNMATDAERTLSCDVSDDETAAAEASFEIPGRMRDASTSMGEGTLMANMATFLADSGSLAQVCLVEDEEVEEDVAHGERTLLVEQEDQFAAQFRIISQDLEASDRELVKSAVGGKTEAARWEAVLGEHLGKSELVRKRNQAQACRNQRRLDDKLRQHRRVRARSAAVEQEKGESSENSDDAASHIDLQLEEEMTRLKDDLLAQVKAGGNVSLTREEQFRTLVEYRKKQRELIERRPRKGEQTDKNTQAKLSTEANLKEGRQIGDGDAASLEERLRQMDDDFYGTLCERQRTRPIPAEQLGQLVSAHVDRVENFRRKLKKEVTRKRREALQKRLLPLEDSPESTERNAELARKLVEKERENEDLVKRSRERERVRFAQKLRAKLANKKKQQEQSDQED